MRLVLSGSSCHYNLYLALSRVEMPGSGVLCTSEKNVEMRFSFLLYDISCDDYLDVMRIFHLILVLV
jgi:hypothetical protein